MPELPEVETIARGLRKLIVGQRITALDILTAKSFDAGGYDIHRHLIGHRITVIDRRAKWLQIHLDNEFTLLVHLRMTGQLVVVKPQKRFGGGHPTDSLVNTLPDRSTRLIFTLDDKDKLYFNDQRKFGFVRLIADDRVLDDTAIGKLGPEPLGPSFDDMDFKKCLRQRNRSNIKAVLLDQRVIAGLGNIYADESLYMAGIDPRAKVNQLSNNHLSRLFKAIREVLQEAIDQGGSTDRNYRKADGRKGSYLEFARVFRRQGHPCPRCHRPIRKIRVAGRGTHFCSTCQKIPRKTPS